MGQEDWKGPTSAVGLGAERRGWKRAPVPAEQEAGPRASPEDPRDSSEVHLMYLTRKRSFMGKT